MAMYIWHNHHYINFLKKDLKMFIAILMKKWHNIFKKWEEIM